MKPSLAQYLAPQQQQPVEEKNWFNSIRGLAEQLSQMPEGYAPPENLPQFQDYSHVYSFATGQLEPVPGPKGPTIIHPHSVTPRGAIIDPSTGAVNPWIRELQALYPFFAK